MNKLKQTFTCTTCGNQKEKLVSQVGKQFFCSRQCYHQSLKNKSPHNKGKKDIHSKPCLQCGSEMTGCKSEIAKKKFCKQQCAGDYFAFRAGSDLSRIKQRIVVDENSGCWLWQGATNGGYGRAKFTDGQKYVHKKAYELIVGPVPDGLFLDHLCRVRNCCNPKHLEPVTHQENIKRGLAGKYRPTESTRKKMSQSQLARYKDDEARADQARRLEKARNDDKRVAALQKALRDPEYRKKASEKMKLIWQERKSAC